jgi:hypothetical protein
MLAGTILATNPFVEVTLPSRPRVASAPCPCTLSSTRCCQQEAFQRKLSASGSGVLTRSSLGCVSGWTDTVVVDMSDDAGEEVSSVSVAAASQKGTYFIT